MKVVVNITLPVNLRRLAGCTLVLDTIRVGFPTAKVTVWENGTYTKEVFHRAAKAGCSYQSSSKKYHHAEWLREMVENATEPLVLLDGDIIFWKACEDLTTERHFMGMYVPLMWNEFSCCVSVPRLHTSFLVVPDPQRFLRDLETVGKGNEYAPCDPWFPCVRYLSGGKLFWDTMSQAFHMLGGEPFTDEVLDRYTHVYSSCFYDEMLAKVGDKAGFEMSHRLATEDPKALRHFNRIVARYHGEMQQIAQKCLTSI